MYPTIFFCYGESGVEGIFWSYLNSHMLLVLLAASVVWLLGK